VKKIFGRGMGLVLGLFTLAVPVALVPAISFAQTTGDNATVHGHVNDAAGVAFKTGDVKFSTDKTTADPKRIYRYTFPIDANGDYKATDVAPGDYLIVVWVQGKSVDFQNVVLKLKDDKAVNFDMTREEYLKSMTPEARAALEATKKKNATAMAENAKIADVNKTLIQARADEKSGKADQAVTELTPLTTQKPDEPIIWGALGEAQLAAADAATAAARAAKTPTTDPALLQKYTDAAASFQKALDLNAASKKPIMDVAFSSSLNMGQALGRSGKPDEAAKAYEAAATANPAMAGTALYNEAATYFNANKLTEAAAAADKAIAADPKRAESYYIKASALVPNATIDPQTKKFVLPPGCLEAYQAYLELAPTGGHAEDVKGLLVSLGQPQKGSFKASGKK
jgi:tetratricopeptide (TPR) repeat protein